MKLAQPRLRKGIVASEIRGVSAWRAWSDIFAKPCASVKQIAFQRPCRGLTHLDECIAPRNILYMTRRAFPALRVIPVQGKFGQTWLAKWMGLEVSSGEVFRRILVIHEFVLRGASKINYFKVQGIRFQLGLMNSIDSRLPIFVICNTHLGEQNCDMHEIFGKTPARDSNVNFGGPAGRGTWNGASGKGIGST